MEAATNYVISAQCGDIPTTLVIVLKLLRTHRPEETGLRGPAFSNS